MRYRLCIFDFDGTLADSADWVLSTFNEIAGAHGLRRVIGRSGIPARETICIGDETRDIDAAKAVGAASGAVFWGYATEQVLLAHSPTLTFRTIADIEAPIRKKGMGDDG